MLLTPGDTLDVVAVNSLPGGSSAMPTFCDQRMFLRSGKFLYCIGQVSNLMMENECRKF